MIFTTIGRDTGSYLELYALDDLISWCRPTYPYWSRFIQLATVNGILWRQRILLEVNITDNSGVLMTTWAPMYCSVTPGLSSGQGGSQLEVKSLDNSSGEVN